MAINFHVFDAMVFDDWRDQANDSPLEDRLELVKELVEQVGSDHVVQVGGITAKDQDTLFKAYGKAIEGGFEGIMVKKLGSPYIFKRSDSVMKLKPVSTYEGVIVGHYEGNRGSKREGLWGGFLVVMPNGVVTKVGGGYNDKIRAEISIDPDSWIGKIVEVEGQPDPLTPDGLTSEGKVRFPVFCRVRDPRDVDPKVIAAGEAYLDGMQ
jgi:ATP-dependent DNA ligase